MAWRELSVEECFKRLNSLWDTLHFSILSYRTVPHNNQSGPASMKSKTVLLAFPQTGFLAGGRRYILLAFFLVIFAGYSLLAGGRAHSGLVPSFSISSSTRSFINALSAYRRDEAIFSMYSGPGFLPALAVLAYNLDQHSPARKRFLYTPWNMTILPEEQEVLHTLGWNIKRVSVLDLPGVPGTARYATGLIKLNAWVSEEGSWDFAQLMDDFP